MLNIDDIKRERVFAATIAARDELIESLADQIVQFKKINQELVKENAVQKQQIAELEERINTNKEV